MLTVKFNNTNTNQSAKAALLFLRRTLAQFGEIHF